MEPPFRLHQSRSRPGVQCPFHEDGHASGSLHQDDDGVWRFTCHAAGCGFSGDIYDIQLRRMGQSPRLLPVESQHGDQRPASTKPKPIYRDVEAVKATVPASWILEATYLYTHPDTRQVEMGILRLLPPGERKLFWQFRPTAGGYVMEAPPKPWPIYNRTRVKGADVVVVVEGEKAVHALHDIGVTATTNPGGAGKADHADWSLLAGKTVYLWPDADPPDPKTSRRTGIVHMQDVARVVSTLDPAPTVLWIDPDRPSLPPKGDAVEFIAGLGNIDRELKYQAVQDVLADAPPWVCPLTSLTEFWRIPSAASGRPSPGLGRLLPGSREPCYRGPLP